MNPTNPRADGRYIYHETLISLPAIFFGVDRWRWVSSPKGSVMMSSPSPNGAQDLHENLLLIGDAAFPGLSNQNELN